MLLEFTHTTELTYTDHIHDSAMELRVCPSQVGDQHRLSFDLAIGPAAQVHSYFDWLDNHVHAFTVNGYHDRIRMVATSVVETDRPEQPIDWLDTLPDTWPLDGVDGEYQHYDFLQFGGLVKDTPLLRQLVDHIAPRDGEPAGSLLRRTLHVMKERFGYKTGVTTSASTSEAMLEKGAGVCQDFTHVLLGALRAMQIPARYCSGIVYSNASEPNQPQYLGASQTHAWVEAYLPSQADSETGGWVGLDATNTCLAGPRFIKVAVGRDYGDVPPNKGVYRGAGEESIEVSVSTRWLSSVPPELMAERVRKLPLTATPTPPNLVEAEAGRLQQQQQQQQQ